MRNELRFILAFFLTLGLLAGCDQPVGPKDAPEGDNVSDASAEGQSLLDTLTIDLDREVDFEQGLVPGSIDATFTKIAQQVGGFAGFYLDEENQVVVRLTDPGAQSATLQSQLPDFLSDDYDQVRKSVATGNFQAKEAKYNFVQLATWKIQLGVLVHVDGLTALGIDEAANQMLVATETEVAKRNMERVLKRSSFPMEAVRVEVWGRVVKEVGTEEQVPTKIRSASNLLLTDFHRPLAGGQEIGLINQAGNYESGSCTLGIVARYGSSKMVLTNSHCTAVNGQLDGTRYNQPKYSDGPDFSDIIGEEFKDAEFRSGLPGCPSSGADCRYSDSAIIDLTDGYFYKAAYGHIFRIVSVGSREIALDSSGDAELIRVGDDVPGVIGMDVNKTGRSTGWTQGDIVDTCMMVPAGVSGKYELCQNLADYSSAGNDSGAPVYVGLGDGSRNVDFIGIHTGKIQPSGRTIISGFREIEKDLGVALKVQDS